MKNWIAWHDSIYKPTPCMMMMMIIIIILTTIHQVHHSHGDHEQLMLIIYMSGAMLPRSKYKLPYKISWSMSMYVYLSVHHVLLKGVWHNECQGPMNEYNVQYSVRCCYRKLKHWIIRNDYIYERTLVTRDCQIISVNQHKTLHSKHFSRLSSKYFDPYVEASHLAWPIITVVMVVMHTNNKKAWQLWNVFSNRLHDWQANNYNV